MLFGFNALRDNRNAYCFCHIGDGFQNADALFLVALVHSQKLRVELNDVDIQVFEHIQRRISAAEVVHQHGKAFFTERMNSVPDKRGVRDIRGFGNFNFNELALERISVG